MRVATGILAGILALAAAGPSWAGKITFQFDAPKMRDTVSLNIVAGNESVLVSVAVGPAVDGAKVKRDELLTRVQTQVNTKKYKWALDKVDPAGFTVIAPADTITATFKPGKTGESKDIEKGDAEGIITFAADLFDPHDADGNTALFQAGAIIGGTEFLATLMADDPIVMDDLSGDHIAAILFSRLGKILPSDGVFLGYIPDTDFLTIRTAREDDGIIFGNTSITDGVIGELTVTTPEPSSLVLLALPLLLFAVWRWRRGAAIVLALTLLSTFPSSAVAGRMGSWDNKAQKFLDPIPEPDNSFSYLALNGGDQLFDFDLASMLFSNKDTMIAKYGTLLFGFDACSVGGFIGNMAATDGKESSLGNPKLVRPNIGVMTATDYKSCSIAGGKGKDAFSAFSKGFNTAVDAPHPDSDAWLGAYKNASKVVQQGQELVGGKLTDQSPQYWSSADAIDGKTLKPGADTQDYAFLVVAPADKNSEGEGAGFWNDLVELHGILTSDFYGWQDAPGSKHELVVLFADGSPPTFVKDKIDWIDGIASSVNVELQLKRVHANFTDQSLGFFYFAAHGASIGPPVPEPASLALFVSGLAMLVIILRPYA